MESRQKKNQSNFEENVRKTGKTIPTTLSSVDRLGTNIGKIKQKTSEDLPDDKNWVSITDKQPPYKDHGNFLNFVESTSRAIENRDQDLQALEQVQGDADTEAYNQLLGITGGKSAHRALESNKRVVDHLRQSALKADEDRVVADRVQESIVENIETLEQDLLENQEVLDNQLTQYAREFEGYMEDMASFTRQEYGAMAELTRQISELDELEASSELGETVTNQVAEDLVNSLEAQARKISKAYNQMVEAYDDTERLADIEPSDVRERYSMSNNSIEQSLSRSDEIFDNMAGCYDSFPERAEAMISESLSDLDELDPAITEGWTRDTYSEEA